MQFIFTLSTRFKEAADDFAGARNVSTAQILREALAQYIGYDLSREVDARTRSGKYASREEKKAAKKERARIKREEEKVLLEALKKGLKKEDLEHIKATLKDKTGV